MGGSSEWEREATGAGGSRNWTQREREAARVDGSREGQMDQGSGIRRQEEGGQWEREAVGAGGSGSGSRRERE